ncbi:helix-turn-helix domain-containing protein [Deinococcus rubellus]|uniref:Helix-turn-helix domain-containing protein n=1 Tax=Deinococcus rubellus TaxID=1889240 RepID=A0ABY5YIZ1_9DEIO|nr:helix-turn-helix domain-containing protein [Deinococcus rubellus]UWX64780.1 helix-turn-helix domain-containing protein [Deinococcus rubellus]
MSLYATRWAYAQDVKPAGRKFVLVAIADFADAEGRAFPGASTIAEMTGQDERSVRRHIDSLQQDGFIKSAPAAAETVHERLTRSGFKLRRKRSGQPMPGNRCGRPSNRTECPVVNRTI